MTTAAAENYYALIAHRVAHERSALASRWLDALNQILIVERNEVFPSDQLLDHIPVLIEQIASYVTAPADDEIAANSGVIDKARELGILRHRQRASVHQLMREYEILGDILETFVVEDTARMVVQPTSAECFDVLRRLNRAVKTLMRATVDTFVTEYTATIQERNERIRTFNRMASHELRSPIGTILFGATLLTNDAVGGEPERVGRVAQTIRANAERLSWLVSNLQRLTRIADPLDTPSQQVVEVESLAREVARQLEEMASVREVEIRIASGLPVLLLDAASLELVLLNLVSNAIKYSDHTKTSRFVEIASVETEEAGVRAIVVRDNGLGIPEQATSEIFERFFRAHAHLDGELGVSGTGLGLAIAAECMHGLHGTIRCESTVGVGTAFVITLPDTRNNGLTE